MQILNFFSRIRERQRKHWKFIIKEVSLAKKSPKGPGLAFFMQILGDISFFSFSKKKYVKEKLKEFKQSFEKK